MEPYVLQDFPWKEEETIQHLPQCVWCSDETTNSLLFWLRFLRCRGFRNPTIADRISGAN